jgi:RTX calcium-binding nonapeptide repeat (4 copies)
MQNRRSRACRAVLATALALALAFPAAAAGRSVVADLHVEAGDRPLAAGSFVTDTARIQTDQRPGCDGSGNVATIQGPTALGLLAHASRVNGRLRPFGVSDEFDFGLFVCGVGDFVGSDTSFWLYKVDHVAPEVGGDQFRVSRGDDVLWYFQDTTTGTNTGDELVLEAPARARSGQPFEVTVWAYDAAGNRTAAADASVSGATVQRTDDEGKATIVSARTGEIRLRAERGSDIPSAPLEVCLGERLRDCPATRGERIQGTSRGDRIRATGGPDVVLGRGGADRISVRGGGRDRVRCGSGRDRVSADRRDRVSRDCEVVRRPRR